MNIIVHDYSGHPFQVHLSRQLAARGHEVSHIYFADNHGPKGALNRQPNDPQGLRFIGITLPRKVKQTAFIARRFNDVEYGYEAARIIQGLQPTVVLCGNTPVEAQRAIISMCKAHNIRFVYWIQDVYGVAMMKLLTKQLGPPGKLAGRYFLWLDRRQFRQSDAIVVITEGFVSEVAPWTNAQISVIENWASLDEITVQEKANSWAQAHGLHDTFTFLYSGTLGRKHNPSFLLKLAQMRHDLIHAVAVVGQGVGKQQLEALVDRPSALKLLPLQPADQLANVLATADVLVATIETDAGKFAVPSKIQSYLCAARPILLAASEDNLAAQTVTRANAGIVVHPSDEAGFLAAAQQLAADADMRNALGANGRAYAERTFDMTRITDRFETILTAPTKPRTAPYRARTAFRVSPYGKSK